MDFPFWHRIQFAFTITYHYLFPQLTMGLALLIATMKTLGLRRGGERWNDAARFWVRIFGINFTVGVVTGVPMEFQFGTNWAVFSRYAGNIIGHTLGMEGLFAFFLESSFLTLLVWGERRVGRIGHWLASLALLAGSWLSGYFIIATNAFMQHPVGHVVGPDGNLQLADFRALLLNPWALAQYAHTMVAAVVTGSFVMAAVGACYALRGLHGAQARTFLTLGTVAGLLSSILVAFPTGDHQAKLVARHQPVSLAAMEGRFESGPHAPMTIIGQPNVAERRLDNPLRVPSVLSFLAFGTFHSDVAGLDRFPTDVWPDNIELLYYAFHIMAGLGTLLMGVMLVASLAHWRGRLVRSRPLLWVLMLAFPFPYIANTAGWLTAELGRQPWVVYGLMRTAVASSPTVHSGTALFTLIGFTGLYFVLGLLFVFLILREIAHGPGPHKALAPAAAGHGA
ncbi:MAG: cytochrome ubiquinol oxidase subunit I [Candidatus Eisenbacteria bacterium]|uniref:Cytochrome ubiquinol oxidase subunit I n=1 Tax=Eiseniibacteriota bacterium TaxID=2212470 RepID=A0A538UD68_UNCEI|nr:MAG: cytochrome ubiquinol oxidase subunit I [Candidatus Eisenbacteria bacterium]